MHQRAFLIRAVIAPHVLHDAVQRAVPVKQAGILRRKARALDRKDRLVPPRPRPHGTVRKRRAVAHHAVFVRGMRRGALVDHHQPPVRQRADRRIAGDARVEQAGPRGQYRRIQPRPRAVGIVRYGHAHALALLVIPVFAVAPVADIVEIEAAAVLQYPRIVDHVAIPVAVFVRAVQRHAVERIRAVGIIGGRIARLRVGHPALKAPLFLPDRQIQMAFPVRRARHAAAPCDIARHAHHAMARDRPQAQRHKYSPPAEIFRHRHYNKNARRRSSRLYAQSRRPQKQATASLFSLIGGTKRS